MTSQRTQPADADLPLRVSTLELFFDLVFVFTITQLTGILARDMTPVGALHVLLIFVVLWWMYDGYVWLSNSKTLSRSPERLLMLLGMTGFLIMGLAIPDTFAGGGSGRDAVALGVGYLIVVAVHTTLYQQINKNIMRVAPFNVASAIAAGLKHAIGHAAATLPTGPSLALAGGVALFLAGDILFRYEMGIAVPRYRAGAAVLALTCWPVAVTVNAAASIALLTALVAAGLLAERMLARGDGPPNPPDPALRFPPWHRTAGGRRPR
jgi:low temperature requirement protein LtrA